MDADSMPSDKAAAARAKAKEIMNALDYGQPGDADKLSKFLLHNFDPRSQG